MSNPRIFCTTQRLSHLRERTQTRPYLSGEQFWRDRHVGRGDGDEPQSPWDDLPREALVQSLTAEGAVKRLAVVCSAGLGKSTTLRWLAKELAAPRGRQVPFFFELDDPRLPDNPWDFWHETLPRAVRRAGGLGGRSETRLVQTLHRLQTQGQLTLLFDSIDQAHERGLLLIQELLASAQWAHCPIVLSARPHAIFDLWDRLIIPDEQAWGFVRVEPLDEPDRKRLLNQDGVDRYGALPPGGQELMANPRNIEYVRKRGLADGLRLGREPASLQEYTLSDLRTASHVFAGAADHMVRFGMTNPKARLLGRRNKDGLPPEKVSQRQILFALDLLGALAFTMYRRPAPGSSPEGERFRPNVSHISASEMPAFNDDVLVCLQAAGVVKKDYQIDELEDDLNALGELNIGAEYQLLDTQPELYCDFRWYDRSLQEFFAAWWLSRYAQGEDTQRLRTWRYDDPRDDMGRTLFQPLWGFLVEMPSAVRKDAVWASAVGVLLEPGVPRCCEMIFRAWPTLLDLKEGRALIASWQGEFTALFETPGESGHTARQIRDGFRRCPGDASVDGQSFLMGSPKDEAERRTDEFQHSVVVSPFLMHQYAVTNAQYELFDPAHQAERWGFPAGSALHPAGDGATNHPVVNVTWFQAWCFAKWTGHHLPTEAQWEYACRGGPCSYQTFHYGNSLSSHQANFDGNFPYGGAEPGPYRINTTPVGSFKANAFGLYDMHGNVWEWCEDWYMGSFYETDKGQRDNPLNDARASARVLRGGSWYGNAGNCRSAFRYGNEPDYRYHDIGFRLAAVPVVGAKQVQASPARRA